MRRVNQIIRNDDLSVKEQPTDVKFRAFSKSVNIVEEFVPVSTNYVGYGIAQPVSNNRPHSDVSRTFGEWNRQEMIDGVQYNVWQFEINSVALSSMSVQTIEWQVEFFEYEDGVFLGIEYYAGEEEAIKNQLNEDYPNAEKGQIVRNAYTQSDWEYDGTDWIDKEDYGYIDVLHNPSGITSWGVERGNRGTYPNHNPNDTSLIFNSIKNRPTFTELEESYYDKNSSDDRYVNQTDYDPEQTKQDDRLTDLENDKLDKSGGNADDDININGVTFNHARSTDAIQGSEYDSRVITVDDKLGKLEGNIDDIYELLDLDGDL